MLFTGALSLNLKNDRSTDPVTASDLTDQTGILFYRRLLLGAKLPTEVHSSVYSHARSQSPLDYSRDI